MSDDFGHRLLHRRGDAFRIGATILLGVCLSLVILLSLVALAARPSLLQALVLGTFVALILGMFSAAVYGLRTRAGWGLPAATGLLVGIALDSVLRSIVALSQHRIEVPLGTIAVVGLVLAAPPALLRRDRPTLLVWLLAYAALSAGALVASALINP